MSGIICEKMAIRTKVPDFGIYCYWDNVIVMDTI